MQDPLHLSLPEFPVSLLGDGGVRASSGPPPGAGHLVPFASAIYHKLGPRRQPGI